VGRGGRCRVLDLNCTTKGGGHSTPTDMELLNFGSINGVISQAAPRRDAAACAAAESEATRTMQLQRYSLRISRRQHITGLSAAQRPPPPRPPPHELARRAGATPSTRRRSGNTRAFSSAFMPPV
jgi:hypothetical protein